MRRFERQRIERRRRMLAIVCLSFAIGALTALGLSWRNHGLDAASTAAPPALVAAGTPRAPVPPHDPTGPAPAGPQLESPADPKPRATTGTSPGALEAIEELRDRDLLMPVDDVEPDDLQDTYFDSRDGRLHEALDIMAPRHTPVRAVEDGRVAKLFASKAGGLTVYVFDAAERFCYYFAHLERYAGGLTDGQAVRRGEVIGYVGNSGNASATAPHLHFAVFRLTPDKRWWQGEALNPYLILR